MLDPLSLRARVQAVSFKVFITLMGLALAMLSVTSVVIWWRKQRAQAKTKANRLTDAAKDLFNRK